jgi:hypothetical protein
MHGCTAFCCPQSYVSVPRPERITCAALTLFKHAAVTYPSCTCMRALLSAALSPVLDSRGQQCTSALLLLMFMSAHSHVCCSDLSKPLPRWRRRMVEISSQTASGMCLRAVGFWNPRVVNYQHYIKGQQIGAVRRQCSLCACGSIHSVCLPESGCTCRCVVAAGTAQHTYQQYMVSAC